MRGVNPAAFLFAAMFWYPLLEMAQKSLRRAARAWPMLSRWPRMTCWMRPAVHWRSETPYHGDP
ncbi:hypothetical protein KCP74_00300 [Salmonella enterica subsp. enterica]|nr:hypothetical protein KCP74_00300 [Salmonella enterica subsp. enterica]